MSTGAPLPPSRKANGGRLAQGRPQSASTPGAFRRQRAIFCEALVPEVADAGLETSGGAVSSMAGPDSGKEIRSAFEKRPIGVGQFLHRRPGVDGPPSQNDHQAHVNLWSSCQSHADEQTCTPSFTNVEPKVCAPYHPPVGRPPRRVCVERLRRRYEALDIGALLRARDIDYGNPTFEDNRTLPLDPFDDSEYDVRSPGEWMALGMNSAKGVFSPLSAQALCMEPDLLGEWRRCRVHAYDSKTQRFDISWADIFTSEDEQPQDDGERIKVSRLQLLFDAEDPICFADRLANAHQARRIAESMIKYNFYIDNMPTDDVQKLTPEQAERLLEVAAETSCGVDRGGSLRMHTRVRPPIA